MQINLLKNSNMKIDVRQKSDNTETDTVLSDKFNKRREQLRYETYEHLVATGFFTGTYEEYKERTKLGLIALRKHSSKFLREFFINTRTQPM